MSPDALFRAPSSSQMLSASALQATAEQVHGALASPEHAQWVREVANSVAEQPASLRRLVTPDRTFYDLNMLRGHARGVSDEECERLFLLFFKRDVLALLNYSLDDQMHAADPLWTERQPAAFRALFAGALDTEWKTDEWDVRTQRLALAAIWRSVHQEAGRVFALLVMIDYALINDPDVPDPRALARFAVRDPERPRVNFALTIRAGKGLEYDADDRAPGRLFSFLQAIVRLFDATIDRQVIERSIATLYAGLLLSVSPRLIAVHEVAGVEGHYEALGLCTNAQWVTVEGYGRLEPTWYSVSSRLGRAQ